MHGLVQTLQFDGNNRRIISVMRYTKSSVWPLSLKYRTLQFFSALKRRSASSLLGRRLSLPLNTGIHYETRHVGLKVGRLQNYRVYTESINARTWQEVELLLVQHEDENLHRQLHS